MGVDEEGEETSSRIVLSKPTGREDGGYQQYEIVIKHPNGKYYEFLHSYNSEHGIDLFRERPNDPIICFEVEPFKIEKTEYRKIPNEKDSDK